MIKNRKKIVILLGCLVLILLTVGVTYAYFTFVTNNGTIDNSSGKLDIDYTISNEFVDGMLSPSTNRSNSLMESVTAKLKDGSVPAKLNIYITPIIIAGIPKEALMWEVDVLNSSDYLLDHYVGNFANSQLDNPLKIINAYSLTNNVLKFNIYIWLDGEKISNENFNIDNEFVVTISADSENITGEF